MKVLREGKLFFAKTYLPLKGIINYTLRKYSLIEDHGVQQVRLEVWDVGGVDIGDYSNPTLPPHVQLTSVFYMNVEQAQRGAREILKVSSPKSHKPIFPVNG